MSVRLTGFSEFEAALKELPKATAKNVLRRTAREAMKRIEDRARDLAPVAEVEGGQLRDSITTKNAKAKRISRDRFASQNSVEVWTGPRGRQEGGNAAWQEFGTVKQAAQPYMRPAADAEADNVIEDVRQALTTQINKAAARMARKAAKGV